jgi:hypothetical protein
MDKTLEKNPRPRQERASITADAVTFRFPGSENAGRPCVLRLERPPHSADRRRRAWAHTMREYNKFQQRHDRGGRTHSGAQGNLWRDGFF